MRTGNVALQGHWRRSGDGRARPWRRRMGLPRLCAALSSPGGMSDLLREHRSLLKDEIIWNIEHGMSLSAEEIGRAEVERGGIINRTARFFEEYDVLVCPTVVSPPFDVDIRYLTEIDGRSFPTYISWLILTFALTLTGCPVISVPCGFTESGLPVGIQIMAPLERGGLSPRRSRPLRAGRRPEQPRADRPAFAVNLRSQPSCSIRSEMRSPIIMVVTLVLARMQSGIMEASTTRSPRSPCILPR